MKKIIAFLFALPVLFPNICYAGEITDTSEKKLQVIEEQTDINETILNKAVEDIKLLDNTLSFRFFGSIALRNCYMTTNVISEPGNFIKNSTGNVFQTRIAAGVTGKFTDSFNYQLRILTSDPKSYNISWLPMGSNLLKIPLAFDRYFITYAPFSLNNSSTVLKFTFGRAGNLFPETELLFDEDVSFNGLSQQFSLLKPFSIIKDLSLGLSENFINTEGTFEKSFMLGAKLSGEVEPMDKLGIKAGLSYISFPGSELLAKYQFVQGYPGENSILNRINKDTKQFSSNFNLIDAFLKIKYKINENLPIELYADFVNNFGSLDKNKGFLTGLSLGQLRQPGDLFFNYNYKNLDQDYNLSFFVQDQMGGTDVRGHEFDIGIQAAQKTKVLLTIQNRMSISKPDNPNLYIFYTGIRQDF